MVSTPAFVAPPRRIIAERAGVAEKYVNMRTQMFTRTHAKSMQQFMDLTGEGEDAYWERWREDYTKSEERWVRDVEQIDSDPNLNFMQKREAKNRLNRMFPAWTMEQEERFIRQYGDPREIARGQLEAAIDELAGPTWRNAMREGTNTEVAKTAWELHFHDALVNPKDGSVPVMLDAHLLAAPPTGRSGDAIGDIVLAGEDPANVDPELLRARRQAAAKICPYCYRQFANKPNRTHLTKCAEDHGRVHGE